MKLTHAHANLNEFILLISNEIVTTAWIAAYSLSYPLLNHTRHKSHSSEPAQWNWKNVASINPGAILNNCFVSESDPTCESNNNEVEVEGDSVQLECSIRFQGNTKPVAPRLEWNQIGGRPVTYTERRLIQPETLLSLPPSHSMQPGGPNSNVGCFSMKPLCCRIILRTFQN